MALAIGSASIFFFALIYGVLFPAYIYRRFQNASFFGKIRLYIQCKFTRGMVNNEVAKQGNRMIRRAGEAAEIVGGGALRAANAAVNAVIPAPRPWYAFRARGKTSGTVIPVASTSVVPIDTSNSTEFSWAIAQGVHHPAPSTVGAFTGMHLPHLGGRQLQRADANGENMSIGGVSLGLRDIIVR